MKFIITKAITLSKCEISDTYLLKFFYNESNIKSIYNHCQDIKNLTLNTIYEIDVLDIKFLSSINREINLNYYTEIIIDRIVQKYSKHSLKEIKDSFSFFK